MNLATVHSLVELCDMANPVGKETKMVTWPQPAALVRCSPAMHVECDKCRPVNLFYVPLQVMYVEYW